MFTIDIVLISKVISIIVILRAGIISIKDIFIIFKSVVVILIIRFIFAKVLFISILFVNIKTN